MNKTQLEALEKEVNDELYKMAEAEKYTDDPITDGVVDINRYLASSPKMLWILKEPYDDSSGWSMTQDVLAKGKFGNKRPFAPIAYITYSVFNNFLKYSEIDYVTDDPMVGESVKNIAYINVKKFPGKSASNNAEIESYYQKFHCLLKRQIDTINPDIVIAGNILHLFYEDFGLSHQDLTSAGTAEFCRQNGRLYINAYHPSYWPCPEVTYVNHLVAIIKEHSLVQPPPKS